MRVHSCRDVHSIDPAWWEESVVCTARSSPECWHILENKSFSTVLPTPIKYTYSFTHIHTLLWLYDNFSIFSIAKGCEVDKLSLYPFYPESKRIFHYQPSQREMPPYSRPWLAGPASPSFWKLILRVAEKNPVTGIEGDSSATYSHSLIILMM